MAGTQVRGQQFEHAVSNSSAVVEVDETHDKMPPISPEHIIAYICNVSVMHLCPCSCMPLLPLQYMLQ